VRISLPPLRSRPDDIPLLIDHFLRDFSKANGKTIHGLTPEARSALYRYSWPGNVRELKNCIESMVVTTRNTVLGLEDIPPYIATAREPDGQPQEIRVGMSLEEVERILIRNTLQMTNGNREEAAKLLKIGERTLYRKIRKYGLR